MIMFAFEVLCSRPWEFSFALLHTCGIVYADWIYLHLDAFAKSAEHGRKPQVH